MWSGWVDYGRRGHAQPWLPRRDEARRGSFRGVHRNDQGSRWNGGRWQQGVDGGFWQALPPARSQIHRGLLSWRQQKRPDFPGTARKCSDARKVGMRMPLRQSPGLGSMSNGVPTHTRQRCSRSRWPRPP